MPTMRQVRRSRVLPAGRGRAWQVLTAPPFAAAWLAAEADGLAEAGDGHWSPGSDSPLGAQPPAARPTPHPDARATQPPAAPATRPPDARAPLDLRAAGSRGLLTEADGTTRQVVVDEVDPHRRLVLHWWGDRGAAAEPSRVEVMLEDAPDGGTRVTITETALADVVDGRSG